MLLIGRTENDSIQKEVFMHCSMRRSHSGYAVLFNVHNISSFSLWYRKSWKDDWKKLYEKGEEQ